MEFLSGNIGTEITEEIAKADAVDIASAYFHPGGQEAELLHQVPELRIYVSEDFTISDPFTLRSLAADNRVKCIPPSSDGGKFHAKVILCHRKNRAKVAFVGSANFTGPGLFSNHETCVKLETQGDTSAIEDIEQWVMRLENLSHIPDWDQACRRHERVKASPATRTGSRENTNYWILKTRSGSAMKDPSEDKEDYWDDFRSEGVIAIGWTELSFNPLGRSRQEIRDRLSAAGRKTSSAHSIDKFVNGITVGDLVLLCRGYAPEGSAASSEKVLFYGYARVEGDFYYDEGSSWWHMKYPVALQDAEVLLPREVFVEAFDKEALIGTIHEKGITEERFYSFCDRVRREFGVSLNL